VRGMRELAASGMRASADLAQRFFDAGNITRGQLAAEQAAAAQGELDLTHATAQATRARAKLNALLALPADDKRLQLPNKLPRMLSADDDPKLLLARARESRVDLQAAAQTVTTLEGLLKSSKRWRWLGDFEVGYARDREEDGLRFAGVSLSLGIPFFNHGSGSVLRAKALLEKAQAMQARLNLQVESQLSLALMDVATQRVMVDHYRLKLLPAKQAVVAENQKRYNFMLIGAFELLQAKREEYDTYQGFLESLRDYWIARAHLAKAVGSALPSDSQIGEPAVGIPSLEKISGDNMPAMDHSKMSMPAEPEIEHQHAPGAAGDQHE
jgi:outer membrane protein, heavy metal efflux system